MRKKKEAAYLRRPFKKKLNQIQMEAFFGGGSNEDSGFRDLRQERYEEIGNR